MVKDDKINYLFGFDLNGLIILFAFLFIALFNTQHAQKYYTESNNFGRERISINDNWKFFKYDMLFFIFSKSD
ncbi:MAG: hypothetical protein OQJ81_12770, partial [Melioribacteraceae bacterium]|nr:hypothetical protein [Melioribacteraceae bacterium]